MDKWTEFENNIGVYKTRILPFIAYSKINFYKETPCHEWEDSLSKEGYGRTFIKGKNYSTHRLAYVTVNGHIPEGLVVDHLCNNPCCCNPMHLEAVTIQENVLRGKSPELTRTRCLAKTHCPQGHEYTPENTYLKEYPNEQGKTYTKRQCKQCNLDRAKTEEAKLKHKAYRLGMSIEEVTLEDGRTTRAKESYAKPRKTHCNRGHELTPENIRIRTVKDKKYGEREKHDCKECMKLRGELK